MAEDSLRPTRAEIDLSAIAHNLAVIRAVAGHSKVLAVVKADAYGHGVVPVAQRLQQEGAYGFGVALAEEALELRDAGITTDIVVLNGVYGGAYREVLDASLTPVVYDEADIAAFDAAARARGEPCSVHLKIDTGMSRLGVPKAELVGFLDVFPRYSFVRVEGVMTHFASAENDAEATSAQLQRFEEGLALVRERGHVPSIIHAANSAATFLRPEASYDMVRPGLALYGVPAVPGMVSDLRPAMRLRTEVIALRDVPVGTRVGYNGTFRAEHPSRIATVPIGYGDGLLRATSNRGAMLARGVRCPVAGTVSMDLTMLDVTDVPGVEVGDEVVLLGEQRGARITADEMAQAASTIGYEMLTAVSRRVPRVYHA